MTRFEPMVLLWAARTSKWRLGNPNQISESWVRKDSVGISPEKFPCWKFLVTEQLAKIFTFSTNFCVTTEKISVFFLQNQFSWPNGQFMPWACHTYTKSHWHKGSLGIFGDPLGASCDPSGAGMGWFYFVFFSFVLGSPPFHEKNTWLNLRASPCNLVHLRAS